MANFQNTTVLRAFIALLALLAAKPHASAAQFLCGTRGDNYSTSSDSIKAGGRFLLFAPQLGYASAQTSSVAARDP